MVNKPSKLGATRKVGRPPKDPDDLRSIRFSFRLHPDLYAEINRQARVFGQPSSMYVERAVVARIHNELGAPILDSIGRYRQPGGPHELPPNSPGRYYGGMDPVPDANELYRQRYLAMHPDFAPPVPPMPRQPARQPVQEPARPARKKPRSK
jgi:hypothetical protein